MMEYHPPGPGTPLGPGTPPWDHTHPQTRHIPCDQAHPLDQAPPGIRHPPVQCTLGDTVNKRAVYILLECNLVLELFSIPCIVVGQCRLNYTIFLAGSLESANSSILAARRHFKDFAGEKNEDFMIIRSPIS